VLVTTSRQIATTSCGSSQAGSLRKVSERLAEAPHEFAAELSLINGLFDGFGDENINGRGVGLLARKRVLFEFREIHFFSSFIAPGYNTKRSFG
jgi:hypothetical protein